MTDIRELANRRAATAQAVMGLGMMNRPVGLAEAIAVSAQFRLLQDAAYKADREYQEAIKTLSVEELNAAASPKGIDQLRRVLRAAQDKLAIFQAHRNPDDPTRLAGMDYTTLMRLIDDCLGSDE